MQYSYRAIAAGGKPTKGVVTAGTRQEALLQLRELGMTTTELTEGKILTGTRNWLSFLTQTEIHLGGNHVKSGDFAAFCRQFATLIRAGVQIVDAVKLLASQTESKSLRKALEEVNLDIQKGNFLSSAITKHKRVFPEMFVNMVKAGEASGNLDEIMDRVANFFEEQHYSGEKIKSAMTYPITVGLMSIAVVIFLMVRIVPTFVNVFKGMNISLPLPTRIVIGASHLLVHSWYLIVLALIGLYVFYRWALRYKQVVYYRDLVQLRIPVFGKLAQKSSIAQVMRTLATLYKSAVPILDALQLTASAAGNEVVATRLREAITSLKNGNRLSDPLRQHWVFPPLVTHMVRIGEETGNLELMLSKVADFYEAEAQALVDRLKTLIEPLMIVFLALIVGVIVSSVIVPIFTIYQHVSQIG
ncbi:type II secretion system F family protein [Alicyclobacillus sp. SO9]|uniref:type II secretion system F family protein n=1 Tax=Alicyclobacillus sp. SO9 TaxID=2665646 RepID=UPI0018E76BED|nr:type II secretion system F family protein [Alicyclobacillus sp. SO9]QQE77544.1 type II secretion system F family protein [Alicyclobacillus sp. SO9]